VPTDPSDSFEERLRAARTRSGQDAQAAPRPAGPAPWGQGMRAGIELVSGTLVGLGIGWGIDWLTGWSPLFLMVFLVLGFVAGVLNVMRLFSGKREPPTGKTGRG
jgi:ATP synthase protein I